MKALFMSFAIATSLLFMGGFSVALAAEKQHDVSIKKFKFIPAEITVNVNDSIRWTNKEKRQYHSVWFEQLGEPEPDYFFPDEFFERTFDKAGDFPYRCGPHPRMKGIVHVVAGDTVAAKKEIAPDKTPVETLSEIPLKRREEIIHILRQDCGSCHGMTLQGGLGPSLLPDALKKMTMEQVAQTISAGRPGTPMPPWKPFFNEQEMRWLAKQLKQGLDKQNMDNKKVNNKKEDIK